MNRSTDFRNSVVAIAFTKPPAGRRVLVGLVAMLSLGLVLLMPPPSRGADEPPFAEMSAPPVAVAEPDAKPISVGARQGINFAPDPSPLCEWRAADPIEVSVGYSTSSLWINQHLSVTASASDTDEFSDDGGATWYSYADDVMTGTSAGLHHVRWFASAGHFTNPYGPSTVYIAPDFYSGEDPLLVYILAVVSDRNIGGDVLGFAGEWAIAAGGAVQVQKVTVTANQGPAPHNQVEGQYTNPIPQQGGGGKLGLVIPGSPPGTVGISGATECSAAKSAPNLELGVNPWAQKYQAWLKIWETGADHWTSVDDGQVTPDFGPGGNGHVSADGLHSWDAPGVGGAVLTGAEKVDHFAEFTTWVEDGQARRISNECVWKVIFFVEVQNGQVQLVGEPQPAPYVAQ